MNFVTLLNILQWDADVSEMFFFDNYSGKSDDIYNDTHRKKIKALERIFEMECIEDFGGEDLGTEYYTVWRFTNIKSGESKFVKFDGWHQSHHGQEYTGCFFVKAEQKTTYTYIKEQ